MIPLTISLALADGTATLGTRQALRAGTVIGVDVLAVGERIRWEGTGSLGVLDTNGLPAADLAASGELVATSPGVLTFTVRSDQPTGGTWDLDVVGASGGRVFSTSWNFNAGSFAEEAATDASFYARVPGGSPGETSVIELRLDGLAGYIYDIRANRVGVEGVAGSILAEGNTVPEEFPIYLRPPEDATYTRAVPTVGSWIFEGALADASAVDGAPLSCDAVRAGGSQATFTFQTDVSGTATLQCDLDLDGDFATVGSNDVAHTVAVEPGTRSVGWDGTDRYGDPVAPGVYPCRVEIRTGEFHYVGNDIETSYPGLRLYEVTASGQRTPLSMVWDDARVQGAAVLMPNGERGLATSPAGGMSSGPYTAPAVANQNARSWGEFAGTGKGNLAFLDTATWLESATSVAIDVQVLAGTEDSDGDGLADFDERCIVGSDPALADSDGDGVPDGTQFGSITSAFDGGLESNGDFATAIGLRDLERIRYGRSPSMLRSDSALAAWVPARGPAGATPVPASPYDLVGTTEAEQVYAVDYVLGRNTVGALLLVETTSVHYSHTKAICDRAAGRSLTRVEATAAGYHRAVLADPDTGARDHAGTLVAIEGSDGWTLHSAWLVDDLPPLEPGQRAVQIQAWTASPGAEEQLLREVADRLGAPLPSDLPALSTHLRSASSWGNTLDVDGPDGWRVVGRTEQGEAFEAVAGAPLPVFSEASIELWDGNRRVDRAWVSDGTWLTLAGPSGTCTPREDRPEGLPLAGCASTPTDETLVRTLSRPRQLSGALSFHASAPSQVCIESATTASFACATASAGWNTLPLVDFEGDVAATTSADLLLWTPRDGNGLVVSGLTLGPAPTLDPETVGCNTGISPGWGGFLLLLPLLRRR